MAHPIDFRPGRQYTACAMEKNPLEIFGITPELVKRLDNEQLFRLVQSNYRLLQKAFHPDVSSVKVGPKRAHHHAVQLNRAFEQLDLRKNEDSFLYFREQYEKKLNRGLRRQLDDKKARLEELSAVFGSLKSNTIEFLLHFLENWEARTNGNTPRPGSSIFCLKNVTLGIFDVAVGFNLRHSSWNLGRNYKEIRFDENQRMAYRQLSRSSFSPVEFIRILGAVKCDQLDVVSFLDKKASKASTLSGNRLPSDFINGSAYELQNTIDLETFTEECLPYLSPALSENSYLFSFHLDTRKTTLPVPPEKVWLEGKIIKISAYRELRNSA